MTSTLLSFSRIDKFRHTGKNAIHSSKAAIHKMAMMNLEKPMISFVLLHRPVSEHLIRILLLVLCLNFVLFLLYLPYL
jgi:hypothetical protein